MKQTLYSIIAVFLLAFAVFAQMDGDRRDNDMRDDGMMDGGMMDDGRMDGDMMDGDMMEEERPYDYDGQPYDTSQGATVFRADCMSCHAQGGNSINPNFPLRGAPQLADFDTFLAFIRHPTMPDGSRGRMPAFSKDQIPDDQARSLYQYLFSEWSTE